jgi:hypothetical protein
VTPISLGIFASANQSAAATSFESIATVSVGSGGAVNVEFTSIPATFTHLQIRGIGRSEDAGATGDTIRIRVNGDTGSNYSTHALGGDGASAYAAQAAASQTSGYGTAIPRNGQTASSFGGTVIEILDYTNTNKYKTIRNLGGSDVNGSGGNIIFGSTAWLSTSAITSITLFPATATDFAQYSQFALYGIKGAV